MRDLVVLSPFADYHEGDRITDPDTVAAILESGQSIFVVPVPASAPPKAETPSLAEPEPSQAPGAS